MNEDRKKALKNLVNTLGFLFQLAAESSVIKNQRVHQWEVISRESPWVDVDSNSEGFIDLVLGKGIMRLVVECKRSLNANWVFLVPKDLDKVDHKFRCQWTRCDGNKKYIGGWDDFTIRPESHQSSFCVIRGTGEGDMSLLERLSKVLLKSADCLSQEETKMKLSRLSSPSTRMYVPVIITTAALEICRFDLSNVSISDGKLSDAEFESVPMVHFRKSLVTQLTPDASPKNMRDADRNKERSVLIISAPELPRVLEQMCFDPKDKLDGFPWEGIMRNIGVNEGY